jgi:hypothetical protein
MPETTISCDRNQTVAIAVLGSFACLQEPSGSTMLHPPPCASKQTTPPSDSRKAPPELQPVAPPLAPDTPIIYIPNIPPYESWISEALTVTYGSLLAPDLLEAYPTAIGSQFARQACSVCGTCCILLQDLPYLLGVLHYATPL